MTEPHLPHQNRLAGETSPYLLQHAANPVDWYPWGEEAFAKARSEDRPILLSIGYSACHWCHVMAHESFEDEATAALMNAHFVNIKVDREERPDIDAVYMTATQALTGQGGWPMTVFMTADGKPFYAGTYFPPEDGHGRPGFPRLLESISRSWADDRAKLLESAESITARLRKSVERRNGGTGDEAATSIGPDHTRRAVELMRANFDRANGGFGGAPKFPSPGNLEFLLAHSVHAPAGDEDRDADDGDDGEPNAREMVFHTLRKMAQGGIYDQLGGGFARYSVDARWLVPHFEKMLYDNAQLVRVYLHAWQLTGDPLFERIVRETLDYLMREMLDGEGGLYAAQDADSEGIEGKYFVWTVEQITAALGEDDGALFNAVHGVSERGNFEDPHHPELTGRNVLSVTREAGSEEEERLRAMRERLLAVRDGRVPPGLDDKLLTSWNGLALAAFAEAGRVLGDARYRAVAERNAAFVRERLWHPSGDTQGGLLLHTYKAGVAKVDGLLEDYSYYGLGLIELYRATGDLAHLDWAAELLDAVLTRFADADGPGFFDSPSDGEALLLRQQSYYDSAVPSGNGSTALLALSLGRTLARPEWEQIGRETAEAAGDQMLAAPTGFGTTWQAIELMQAPHHEVAIVGDPAAREPLERELARHFLPSTVIAPAATGGGLPLLEGRDGESATGALAYVCEQMACQLPVATAEELAAQLKR
ncbi:MAG: thioredoxin domain-containing protein [Dehalococcoidia bacterium]